MVVNYDLPDDYESYVHRIGRTARAGKSGKSISLADEEYVFNLEAIEEFIQMKIPVVWPDMDEVAKVEDKSARLRPERWGKPRGAKRRAQAFVTPVRSPAQWYRQTRRVPSPGQGCTTEGGRTRPGWTTAATTAPALTGIFQELQKKKKGSFFSRLLGKGKK